MTINGNKWRVNLEKCGDEEVTLLIAGEGIVPLVGGIQVGSCVCTPGFLGAW